MDADGTTSAYLSDCKRHQAITFKSIKPVVYSHPPPLKPVPSPRWFLSVYVRNVFGRLEFLKASATSVFGLIFKINSTKKITQKLQGLATNSASWCTNVGNENRAILLSLLTISEGQDNLQKMADGLMDRYEQAHVSPPGCSTRIEIAVRQRALQSSSGSSENGRN
jgi:hypothetical protein